MNQLAVVSLITLCFLHANCWQEDFRDNGEDDEPEGVPFPFSGDDEITMRECGHTATQERTVQTLIVGGHEASMEEYPYQVSLQRANSKGQQTHFCGGSILNKNWILTAGHCVPNMTPQQLNVVAGTDTYDVGGQRFNVSKILTNGYDAETMSNDIALVKLARPIKNLGKSDKVQGMCLPHDDSNFDDSMLHVSGWGTMASGATSVPKHLRAVTVRSVGYAQCKKAYNGLQQDAMLCCAAPGRDSCQGDSGGPLVMKDKFGRCVQAGVVSFGSGCADSKFPGVYTKTTKHLKWIAHTIKNQ